MAIPDFQSWFLPLLKQLSDGESRPLSDLYSVLADELSLSEADRNEFLPSGKHLTFKNRISWAGTYLKKAGLVESPVRGELKITDLGRQVLAEPPERLDVRYLKSYPSFERFHAQRSDTVDASPVREKTPESEQTPEERLESAHRELKDDIAQQVLDRVKAAPPSFFETLVVELLLRMGYGGSREDAGQTIGRSGDGGIDGLIKEDRLGLDVVYIQAKRWENTVGRPVVQAFAGSLDGVRAKKGVLITTSKFSAEANQYVLQIEKRIVLIDGEQLADLMFEHNLGVSLESTYEVKRIDTDFFESA